MIVLSRQGRIGVYPPTTGQEAASIGPAHAMRSDDWLVPSFREMPAMLYRGWPMEKLILGWWGGHEHGAVPPEGLNFLPLCGPVATQCQYAAGIAMGEKLRQSGRVVVCFVGDGGTSEGDFHESMNIAAVFRLPLVMIVQNNQWAISMPRARQTASRTIAQKAIAYGMDGLVVDGNDILAMVTASREAIEKARTNNEPTLIEALTYRLGQHSTADHAEKYRCNSEVEPWLDRDPLPRFEKYLRSCSLLDDAKAAALESGVNEEILAGIAAAERYKPDITAPFQHCFAELPASLRSQLAEFKAYLAEAQGPQPEEPNAAKAPILIPA